MHALTKYATARLVDKLSQKGLRCLICGGPAGVDAPVATLAPRIRLMSMVTLMATVNPSPRLAFVWSSANELFDTWFRFLVKQTFEDTHRGEKDYVWYKFNIFTCWTLKTNRSIVLVFDPRPAIKDRLPSPLLDSCEMSDITDPYWIHALFAEELVRLQDDAVWGIRNLVRKIEVNRTTSTAPNPD